MYGRNRSGGEEGCVSGLVTVCASWMLLIGRRPGKEGFLEDQSPHDLLLKLLEGGWCGAMAGLSNLTWSQYSCTVYSKRKGLTIACDLKHFEEKATCKHLSPTLVSRMLCMYIYSYRGGQHGSRGQLRTWGIIK